MRHIAFVIFPRLLAGALTFLTVLVPLGVRAQGTVADYARAEAFLWSNADTLVLNESVEPRWIGDTGAVWYRHEEPSGTTILRASAEAAPAPAFDHAALAAALARLTGDAFDADDLPVRGIDVAEGREVVELARGGDAWRCTLPTLSCEALPEEEPAGRSPDGEWQAFVRDHDLYVRSLTSGEEIRLTHGGAEDYGYAQALASPVDMVRAGRQDVERPVRVRWAPDSRRLVSFRLDSRSARRYGVYESVPGDQVRPKFYSYVYPVPGERGLPVVEPVVFDLDRRTPVHVDVDPLPILYTTSAPLPQWSDDGEHLYLLQRTRGYKAAALLEIDPATGAARTVVEEAADTHVDPHMNAYRLLESGEVLWTSERDGWHHLYLYDGGTGALKRQVTRGPWVVRDILHVDEAARTVYFSAGGREEGRDPYLRHVYRVGLDGGPVTLLTPEDADHEAVFSPDGTLFADTYSRVDRPTRAVLRRSRDGAVVQTLAEADVSRLLATGWRFPEPFRAKGRDGETDVYGVLWRPTTFDSTRTYPVVEQIYTGPHGFHVPKTFTAYRSTAQSIAELGFVTVQVDGMGTGRRSRAFGDVSYQNLGDGGLPDHVAALRQLGTRYPYLDLDRVGVYGHSAGGYDSAHALLTHPDFYKVAVSSAGNHDHRLDKAWWIELWMGSELGEHYEAQSNPALADRLQGKLLLVHGEVDENVHPASTMRLVDALIKANKDFDMLIMPGEFHSMGRHPYFIARRWDYFVEHLLGVEPPRYVIGDEREPSSAALR